MANNLKQIPLTCSGHTRPVVHLDFSDITDCGYFLISACKGKSNTSSQCLSSYCVQFTKTEEKQMYVEECERDYLLSDSKLEEKF